MRLHHLYDPFSGRLERELFAGSPLVPIDMSVQGGCLRYRFARAKVPDFEKQGRKLLTDFLALAEAEEGKIQDYAHRYGVLGLCSHWLPYGHPSLRPLMIARIAVKAKVDFADLVSHAHAGIDAACFPSGKRPEPDT